MRFLTDQDVYAATVRFLAGLGNDVLTAAQIGLASAADDQFLQAASNDRRILVTRDRDYGGLVFVQGARTGVIYLLPATAAAVHHELQRVLTMYAEPELLAAFMVVEPRRHRIRRFPP